MAAVEMASIIPAQTSPKKTEDEMKAAYEAHKADFDYLLGDWEFTTVSKTYGKGRGYWSAVRLATGQILDEFRIVGDNDETYYVTTTLRAYNAAQDRWELVGMNSGGGLQDIGAARRVGAEVHIEQNFGVAARMSLRCGFVISIFSRIVFPGRRTARTMAEKRGSPATIKSRPGELVRRVHSLRSRKRNKQANRTRAVDHNVSEIAAAPAAFYAAARKPNLPDLLHVRAWSPAPPSMRTAKGFEDHGSTLNMATIPPSRCSLL